MQRSPLFIEGFTCYLNFSRFVILFLQSTIDQNVYVCVARALKVFNRMFTKYLNWPIFQEKLELNYGSS